MARLEVHTTVLPEVSRLQRIADDRVLVASDHHACWVSLHDGSAAAEPAESRERPHQRDASTWPANVEIVVLRTTSVLVVRDAGGAAHATACELASELVSDVVELESEVIFRGPRTLPITFTPKACQDAR